MPARKFTDEQEAEICRRYLDGDSTVSLGRLLGADNSVIGRILRRNGISARSVKEANGGLTDEQESDVCSRYANGESTYEIGRGYGVSNATVSAILHRNSVQPRGPKEAKGGLSSERELEVCSRYKAGETSKELEKAYGVTDSTICNILRRNGIETRGNAGIGDSVRDALDGTGCHDRLRECEFYLFELARYTETHCKPGIAFNADARVACGQGEYGAEVLRLFFATRQEAYFLEQAVLDATRGHRDCPDDLQGWDGASEVRAMPAEDLLPIALRLAEELELMGAWEFAAAYVPMTTAQRAACQQRAAKAFSISELS
jgi:DNA-binding NarL/FixJ family response regulator